MVALIGPLAFGFLDAPQCLAQSQAETTPVNALVFEVASIKPNQYASWMLRFGWFSPDRFSATGISLQELLRFAFGAADNQISGVPKWLNSKRYDIEAKEDKSVVEEVGKGSFDQRTPKFRHLIQALLVDRFKLTLVEQLSRQPELSDRVVLDETGLKGDYDFKLQWTPDILTPTVNGVGNGGQGTANAPSSNPSAPSLFTAVQEQLGLKLESTKGRVDVIVIDNVEEPSEN